MLGLKNFSTPQFSIPSIPADERALHKIKDVLSFFNSIQWKADEDKEEDEWGDTTRDVKFDMNEGRDQRRGAEATMQGFDPNLASGHDVSRRIGSTRWDNMDGEDLWEQAMNSVATGENPLTKGYADLVGGPGGYHYSLDQLPSKSRRIGWDDEHLKEYINSPITIGRGM
jgi:hypothetical protein